MTDRPTEPQNVRAIRRWLHDANPADRAVFDNIIDRDREHDRYATAMLELALKAFEAGCAFQNEYPGAPLGPEANLASDEQLNAWRTDAVLDDLVQALGPIPGPTREGEMLDWIEADARTIARRVRLKLEAGDAMWTPEDAEAYIEAEIRSTAGTPAEGEVIIRLAYAEAVQTLHAIAIARTRSGPEEVSVLIQIREKIALAIGVPPRVEQEAPMTDRGGDAEDDAVR